MGDDRLTTARSTMVLVDRYKRRPAPIDDALGSAMAPLFIADGSAVEAGAVRALMPRRDKTQNDKETPPWPDRCTE